jgi:hypothetical protein
MSNILNKLVKESIKLPETELKATLKQKLLKGLLKDAANLADCTPGKIRNRLDNELGSRTFLQAWTNQYINQIEQEISKCTVLEASANISEFASTFENFEARSQYIRSFYQSPGRIR